MMIINAKKKGMALIVVFGIATVLLVLGMTYLKSFSQTKVTSNFQLDRVQADYFARGIQNIALLKIRRYPDFFIRGYKLQYRNPSPDKKTFTNFLYDKKNGSTEAGGILQNYIPPSSEKPAFEKPDKIAAYSTEIRVMSAKDFDEQTIEITVNVETIDGNRDVITPYRTTVSAKQVIK